MCVVPPEFEGQYHRFLEGRGAVVSSLVLYLKGKRLIGSDSGAWAAFLISRIYTVKGRLLLASSYLRLSCSLFLIGDSKKIPLGLWINRAVILKMRGKYREAIGLLRRIFRLSLEKGEIYVSAKAALNLALILARSSDFREAQTYLEYASLNYSILGRSDEIARVELARSFVESRRGSRPETIDRLQDQLSHKKESALTRESLFSRLLLAEILLKEGEYDKAKIFLEEIKYESEALNRFRPIKIRWLILKTRLEEAVGKQINADYFKKTLKSECRLNGIFDPEAEPENRTHGHNQMTLKTGRNRNLPFAGKDSCSVAEESVSARESIRVKNKDDLFANPEFISNDMGMNLILEEIKRFSPFPFPILLAGESGTGKEVIARLIHHWSNRSGSPFLPVNTAAVPPDLFEAQLFGHKKGSFTGAVSDRAGLIDSAGRGTIFLDEIGELTTQLQAKLLRLLENGEYIRVGDSRVRMNEARIIAATNKDLSLLAERGQFRKDFYYRMAAFAVQIPPLRERSSDLALLSEYFLEDLSERFNLGPFYLSNMLEMLFISYSWPGNVRELKNELTSAAIRRKSGKLRVCDLSTRFISRIIGSIRSDGRDACNGEEPLKGKDMFSICPPAPETFGLRMRAIEKKELLSALSTAGGNKTKAAMMLGLKRTTFIYRLKRSGLDLD